MTIEERKSITTGVIQNLILENRGKLSISGVLDVLSFDDQVVIVETELGLLTVKGENIRINKLSIDEKYELTLQGVKILLQNHKSLLPYGYPFAYVENIHHQYILIFRKTRRKKK